MVLTKADKSDNSVSRQVLDGVVSALRDAGVSRTPVVLTSAASKLGRDGMWRYHIYDVPPRDLLDIAQALVLFHKFTLTCCLSGVCAPTLPHTHLLPLRHSHTRVGCCMMPPLHRYLRLAALDKVMRQQDVANTEGGKLEDSSRGGTAWTRVARREQEKKKGEGEKENSHDAGAGLQQSTPAAAPAGVGAPASGKGR